jgi:hypothetical protein
MHFGARSERLPEEQLQLGFEAIEQAIAKADAEAEKRDPELRKDRLIRKLQLDKEILADRESTQSPD